MNKNILGLYLADWKQSSLFGRFEKVVAILLSIAVSIVVVLSVARVFLSLGMAVSSDIDILDYQLFQTVFGMIMVVLIAMEFNHIIIQIAGGTHVFAQVRVVVAIAILAVVRKFIILDIKETPSETIFALAASVLALGGVYWLIRDGKLDTSPSGQ